jgi:CheY-specific phosphatase CheX
MFSVFFGQFLLNEGLIDTEQLNKLLSVSKETRVKLGVLAINSGLMTADNVNHVNELQGKMDKRFGEIAIDQGYLTEPELELLLNVQSSEHLKLSQTLVDAKLMTIEEVAQALDAYKSKYSLSDEAFEAFKDGKARTIIDTYLDFKNDSFTDLYKEYISLFYKNVTRFVDANLRIEQVEIIDEKSYEVIIKQDITGPRRIYTGFAGTSQTMIRFASNYADEVFDTLDDYAQDALGEFLNLNNGLYLVNLSNYGVDLSLQIQTLEKNYSISANKVYCIPFFTSFGRIDLLISLTPIA